jgi:hypothetical protein
VYKLVPIALIAYIFISVYELNTYSALRKNPPKTMKGIMTMGRMLRHTSRLGQAQDTRYPARIIILKGTVPRDHSSFSSMN